jgi:hypothetical protein
MKTSQLLLSTLAVAVVASIAAAPAAAAPRAACSVLTLAQVRAIVAAPVEVYQPGSSVPTTQGTSTFSTCTYVVPNTMGRAGRLSLLWGPTATLTTTYNFYVKRGKELARMDGDMLVLASVTITTHGGTAYDQPASSKLMKAALAKLP